MNVVVLGGAGFVGLNICERLLAEGHGAIAWDVRSVPDAAARRFAGLPGSFRQVTADLRAADACEAAIAPGTDILVLGAAITAGAERDAREPGRILDINLLGSLPALERARAVGVRRVINLSSAAAYGRAATRAELLTEDLPSDPESLYAITKFGSERVLQRLGALWGLDTVSVRLSAVFGPWEHGTGVRDTLSPQLQILDLAREGRDAVLARPAFRDWVFAPDVAEAVLRLAGATSVPQPLYNVSTPERFSALEWGEALARIRPGFRCRLAEEGEAPTVTLHDGTDRAPLDTARLRDDLGWSAPHGREASAAAYWAWAEREQLS